MTPATAEQIDAWNAVKRAVRRGKLVPQPCEIGEGCSGPIEAHHDDYASPLKVRWLCHRHHRNTHRMPREVVHALAPYSDVPIEIRGPLGCHIWRGATTPRGYPVMKIAGKVKLVRRIIYQERKRVLQPGEIVKMQCGERLCVNEAHMEAKPR